MSKIKTEEQLREALLYKLSNTYIPNMKVLIEVALKLLKEELWLKAPLQEEWLDDDGNETLASITVSEKLTPSGGINNIYTTPSGYYTITTSTHTDDCPF